jgi:hypothetical protein
MPEVVTLIDELDPALLEDYLPKLGDEGKDFLHRIRNASQRMGELIDDLLALSRVTRSDMAPMRTREVAIIESRRGLRDFGAKQPNQIVIWESLMDARTLLLRFAEADQGAGDQDRDHQRDSGDDPEHRPEHAAQWPTAHAPAQETSRMATSSVSSPPFFARTSCIRPSTSAWPDAPTASCCSSSSRMPSSPSRAKWWVSE